MANEATKLHTDTMISILPSSLPNYSRTYLRVFGSWETSRWKGL